MSEFDPGAAIPEPMLWRNRNQRPVSLTTQKSPRGRGKLSTSD